jgi:putative methyltransferase (TIGR01177 family)
MIVTVWLSGENERLAQAELAAAAQRLGGRSVEGAVSESTRGRGLVELPDRQAAANLAARLALARRCAEEWLDAAPGAMERRLRSLAASGSSAAFQWVSGTPEPRPPETLHRLGGIFRMAGGRIDLEHAEHRFWLETAPAGPVRIYEEIGRVDRSAFSGRQTPRLPFQRPVTLAPRLARTLVNLARVGPGDRVVDPFVGTGSLLLEAALLGATTVGIDVSATMIRGAIENFAHLGHTPEILRQADAAEAAGEFAADSFDALVTDPPYGRASGTRGERPDLLWRRALQSWTEKVRPGGRLAVVMPAGARAPELDARLELAIPQRVHRSLTREFRVYVRPTRRSASR